jgi:hypothetical protein
MKLNQWLVLFLGLAMLTLAGCGGGEVKPPDYLQINDVRVDMPQLEQAFASATPEQRTVISDIQAGIRYGDYVKALMNLETLSQDAALTDP